MQSKSQIHQKSNFIKWSKKALTFFVFIAFLGIVIAQTSNKETNKNSKFKDSIAKSKNAITEKKQSVSDTIKELNQQEVIIDSLFLGTGTFKLFKKNAHASYYADKFHGRKTANGKRYDKNKLTAAHKKLPFGTIVKVTNEANGKSLLVEINDRGPFVRYREIDLSRRAFMEITGNKSFGKLSVTLEILQK